MSGSQTDVIFTNFWKAFNTIDHDLFITKLKQIRVVDPMLRWLYFCCLERKQFVKYKTLWSSHIDVSSGVSQGSYLGPISNLNIDKCKYTSMSFFRSKKSHINSC